jgi:small subunit ribosomal protein S6
LANCDKIYTRDMLYKIFLALSKERARDQKEVQTTMNKYELALVVNAKIEDEARTATVDAVKELITRFGGTITNVDEWGKKRLAYEIQKMKEGFYYFIQFDADSTCPGEVEDRIRIMENVIRFLCIRQDA